MTADADARHARLRPHPSLTSKSKTSEAGTVSRKEKLKERLREEPHFKVLG
jgi:hypothetical protein